MSIRSIKSLLPFNFTSVPSGQYIRILIRRSYSSSNHAPSTLGYFAYATPEYFSSSSGIVNGFVYDYVHTGSDPAAGFFHGEITVNFDTIHSTLVSKKINYQDDYTAPFQNCLYDLYTTLLHEMGHVMGFFSLVKFNNNPVPVPAVTSNNVFTGLDNSVRISSVYMHVGIYSTVYGIPYPFSFTKLLNSSTLSINSGTNAYGNYWINSDSAPNNHALYSGNLADTGQNSLYSAYLMHMEDQLWSFTARERISPGDQQEYVMGAFGLEGVLRRTYTKGEIECFHNIIGYPVNSGFNTSVTNHTPNCYRMETYQNYSESSQDYIFPEEVVHQAQMTNNVSSSFVINLNDPQWGFADADGDSLRVDTSSLINFRGAGIGGNNHNCLAVSSTIGNTNNVITYTPRANYYGRTQFGFNLYDGKEKGSFVLFTIDVDKGSNVSCSAGSNIVLNGDIEEGSEVKIKGSTAGESVPNSLLMEGQWHEGKLNVFHFSDSHPFSHLNGPWPESGPVIGNSYIL